MSHAPVNRPEAKRRAAIILATQTDTDGFEMAATVLKLLREWDEREAEYERELQQATRELKRARRAVNRAESQVAIVREIAREKGLVT